MKKRQQQINPKTAVARLNFLELDARLETFDLLHVRFLQQSWFDVHRSGVPSSAIAASRHRCERAEKQRSSYPRSGDSLGELDDDAGRVIRVARRRLLHRRRRERRRRVRHRPLLQLAAHEIRRLRGGEDLAAND